MDCKWCVSSSIAVGIETNYEWTETCMFCEIFFNRNHLFCSWKICSSKSFLFFSHSKSRSFRSCLQFSSLSPSLLSYYTTHFHVTFYARLQKYIFFHGKMRNSRLHRNNKNKLSIFYLNSKMYDEFLKRLCGSFLCIIKQWTIFTIREHLIFI